MTHGKGGQMKQLLNNFVAGVWSLGLFNPFMPAPNGKKVKHVQK